MEGGIFLCHWYFLLKAYLRRRRTRGTETQDEEAPKLEERVESTVEQDVNDMPLNPIFSSTSRTSGHSEHQTRETEGGIDRK